MVEVILASEGMVPIIAKIAETARDVGPWYPQSYYLAAVRKSRMLVVVEDRLLLGFLWFIPKEDEHWQLFKIVVAPPARHKGVGKLLTNTLIEEAASVGHGVTLKVTIHNSSAIAFYQGLGFKAVDKTGKEPYTVYVMERAVND